MNDMSSYIQVYDSIIPKPLCDLLISKFDECDSEIFNDSVRKFSQINLIKNKKKFDQEIKALGLIFKTIVTQYQQQLKIKHFPQKYAYEEFRIKKYNTDSYFEDHVDVYDHNSARRFLSIFSYLNESPGTNFYNKTIDSIAPGSIVVFPPMWMFPHKAIIPAEGKKYFLGTYLHYI